MSPPTIVPEVWATEHPEITFLINGAPEAATGALKIVVASEGAFEINGRRRTAFLVGARLATIRVGYDAHVTCWEWSVPAWMARALLDVPGTELTDRIVNLDALSASPFAHALARTVDPAALDPTVVA